MAVAKRDRFAPEPGYVNGWAPRRLVEDWYARGWEAVPGKSPDGNTWRGDSMLMRMKVADYQEMTKRSREPYDAIRRRIDKGELPVDTSSVSVGKITSERTTTNRAEQPQ